MINRMLAIPEDDSPPLKKIEPFSRKEKRARVFPFGIDEIGLLDLVLLDAITESEAHNR